MQTAVESEALGSALEVAISFTMGGLGTIVGARYSPPSIRPQVGPEHPGPTTDYSTLVSVAPETVALSRNEYPTAKRVCSC